MSNQLHWSFQGTVVKREDKQSKAGKTFSELVLDLPGAKYPSICVCVFFGELPTGTSPGAEVYADGYMNGRLFNGKHYAGLKASNVRVIAPATAPANVETDGMPF